MFSALQDLVTETKKKMQGYQTTFDLMSSIDFSVIEIVDKDPQQKKSAAYVICVIVTNWEVNNGYVYVFFWNFNIVKAGLKEERWWLFTEMISEWNIIYTILNNVSNVDSKMLECRQKTFEIVYDVNKRSRMFIWLLNLLLLSSISFRSRLDLVR